MLKRFVVILFVLAIAAGFLSRSAAAGPPWPAEVVQIREGDFCWFTWLNDNYEFVYPTGTGMWEVQYHNGKLQWNCHTILNYNDPNIASLDQVCWFVDTEGGLNLCNGKGSFVWTSADEQAPFGCSWEDAAGNIYYSDTAHMVATPNGNVNISCHFDITP